MRYGRADQAISFARVIKGVQSKVFIAVEKYMNIGYKTVEMSDGITPQDANEDDLLAEDIEEP